MNILEMTWTDDEGNFTLSLTWPTEADEYDRAEVGRILHRHGFASLGGDRWAAPDDTAAPLSAFEAISRFGIATSTATDILPPALEAKLAALPFM